jgi:DNA primase
LPHILAPIKPELAFPHVRDFAKALAKEVERRIDDQSIATTTWKVADRDGVFVDYGQNARELPPKFAKLGLPDPS